MAVTISEKLSASLEDYLEAIYHLIELRDVARSKDIAERMGVSRASVTGALRTLAEKGLVHYQPYGYTTLTKNGIQIARKVADRHDILGRFFQELLGADASVAQAAACRAEHTLGPEITARLMAFVEFISGQRDKGQDIAEQFSNYWQKTNGNRD
ncbi:MAG: metal-dependent transcriptional regulator [Planctomycetota bacterium]|jgi:DtxR family Mn-dependent transcriptional regulator